ncbi:MAG: hypothetical protein HY904_13885 [Deltaproteobacteria bacterium]|nr:hypothetical protein [Deltaproteobacteria bacterium]
MSQAPPDPKDPPGGAPPAAADAADAAVDVEPVVGALTLEAPEALTQDDLDARALVGFALDLEPFLPGPAVGSERILLEEDPDAARRLGVRPDVSAPPPAPAPSPEEPAPATVPAEHAPAAALPAHDTRDVDVEPVLEGAPLEPPPPPPLRAPAAPAPSPPPAAPAWLASTGAAPAPPPPTFEMPRPRVGPSQPPPSSPGARVYPAAWNWAGLGNPPVFGAGRAASRPARVAPETGARAPMEELLDLAAVGKGDDGVTEMLLLFKEDVLRGLSCKLRLEPAGMRAYFVAPDENVKRYVEGTAEDLLARMRRRGLKVAGWTVEVGG